MILTTRGRYAVMAIIDLLEYSDGRKEPSPISLLSISQRQNISLSYLEQIFSNLRKAGIVKSVKGPGGGYSLKKNPSEITISEIIQATGENIKMTGCNNDKDQCAAARHNSRAKCRTHELWTGLEKHIHKYLNSISLQDFLQK